MLEARCCAVLGTDTRTPFPEYETILALDPNWINAYVMPSTNAGSSPDRSEETILLEERAIRSQPPRSDDRQLVLGDVGRAHLAQSRTEEAIFWFELACNSNLGLPVAHAYLASAYALRGDAELAVAKLAEARRLSFGDRYASIGHLKAAFNLGECRRFRALFETTYFKLVCTRLGLLE